MAQYTQNNRPISIHTPLGPDVLLLEKFTGEESLSQLYFFELSLLAQEPIDFEKLIGQSLYIKVKLPDASERIIHGIINQLSRGGRLPPGAKEPEFIRYEAQLVPEMWLMTRRVQSRIFQDMTGPAILNQILVSEWGLQAAFELNEDYFTHNYFVQYQESDFALVSRLMEQEGIRYYFQHTDQGAILKLGDTRASRPKLPHPTVVYDEGASGDFPTRIQNWQKTQGLQSHTYSVGDYHFQLADKNLNCSQDMLDNVKVGTVNHRLNFSHAVKGRELLEVYEFPGHFAPAFDGIDQSGNQQPENLNKIFPGNEQAALIRMQEEAAKALVIRGSGNCAEFTPGFEFTLDKHFEDCGDYLLSRVKHYADLNNVYYSVGEGEQRRPKPFIYENEFECKPSSLPYRPPRLTPRPLIHGAQTAAVVGPEGQEIYLDKYGRVKVRFPWNLQDKEGNECSCWVRVAQIWAGKTWGAFFWPRIGHEVVVAFEYGDPNRPLIVGSVYNNVNMPPLPLPDNATLAGMKSCIFGGNPQSDYNAIVIHDASGEEFLQFHSEKDAMDNSEFNRYQYVPNAKFTINGYFPLLGE